MLDDIIPLFCNEDVLNQYPLRIHFVGKRAIDIGGVCCDMLEEFQQAAYVHHFEGSGTIGEYTY